MQEYNQTHSDKAVHIPKSENIELLNNDNNENKNERISVYTSHVEHGIPNNARDNDNTNEDKPLPKQHGSMQNYHKRNNNDSHTHPNIITICNITKYRNANVL